MDGEHEAVEMRPWRAEDGPRPKRRVYPYGERPLLAIRIGGRWHGPVRARADWADGRVAVHVDVFLWDRGGWATFPRVYQWDQAVMRLV